MLHLQLHQAPSQLPLIHTIDQDDQLLLNSPEAQWYRILKYFPDVDYRRVAADYYNSLYHFNMTRTMDRGDQHINDEDKPQATQRLLFERATMNDSTPIIFEQNSIPPVEQIVTPEQIAPGITPDRIGGKKPKCFFAMFKSFTGASIMGFAPEPENVYALLSSNLSFARVCGFVPKGADESYWYQYVPSLRKLEQFDQIMTEYGLWSKAKWDHVRENIDSKIIKKENELVGDTTHYHGQSVFKTIQYTDCKGKEKKKSQSKTTKKCRCEDPNNCPHPWELADDGAGTITKAHNRYIWGHKASILGLPLQGIPLDAVAVSDAATHDGETLYPHVVRLFENLPQVYPWIDTVLYDGAADTQGLREKFDKDLNIRLRASLNPRRRKSVTINLPRGMEKITPCGNLVCKAGFEMDYRGMRHESERFIYHAPKDDSRRSVCLGCEHKSVCCRLSKKGRVVTLPFSVLPHIDPKDPPMAKRFKAMMTHRPSVERMIKRLKCDLSDDRLKKRGNAAFQSYLDKTMIAFHILLRQ
ncbi:MAG: hypothetical protein JSV83_10470 [Desulfobacterales bacterium]|nr:MAG: hypothetical protein JSV83_10470 [Desulfobacterales bacterium]